MFKWVLGRWELGRQQSGYDKFCFLYSKILRIDGYILRFPTGSKIPLHIDPIDGFKHYRLNIVFWRAEIGGRIICKDPAPIFRYGNRICLFRSDLSQHAVSEILKGTRYVLSLGVALK